MHILAKNKLGRLLRKYMAGTPPKKDNKRLFHSLLESAAAADDMESLPFLMSIGADIHTLQISHDFSEQMVKYVKKLQKPSADEIKQKKEAHNQILQAINDRSLKEKISQYKRKAYIAKKGETVKYSLKSLNYENKSILGLVTAGISEGSWPSCDGKQLMPVLQFSKDDLPNFVDIFGADIELAAFYSPSTAAHSQGREDYYFELHLYEKPEHPHVIPDSAPREKKARYIKWKEVDDYPSSDTWEEVFSKELLKEINEVIQLNEELSKKTGIQIDIYDLLQPQKKRHYGTKVGGYPDFIQSKTQFPEIEGQQHEWEFLFQIDEKDFDTLNL